MVAAVQALPGAPAPDSRHAEASARMQKVYALALLFIGAITSMSLLPAPFGLIGGGLCLVGTLLVYLSIPSVPRPISAYSPPIVVYQPPREVIHHHHAVSQAPVPVYGPVYQPAPQTAHLPHVGVGHGHQGGTNPALANLHRRAEAFNSLVTILGAPHAQPPMPAVHHALPPAAPPPNSQPHVPVGHRHVP